MKKQKYNLTLILFSILTLCFSCSEVIEENLEKESIQIIRPQDNLITTYSTQTFEWGKVEGADQYNIQIVNGSFSQINYFVLDSSITATSFVYNLSPGSYQWRVQGVNSVSNTAYASRSIQIDSTADLSGSKVLLVMPEDNFLTKDTSLTFNWQKLYNADEYIFQLRKGDFSGIVVYSDTLSSTSVSLSSPSLEEGEFSWGVKALNQTSSTSFSTYSFSIDLTAPASPGIINTDTIQNNPFTLNWNRVANDVDFDSLYIYSNKGLTNIVVDTIANESYTDSLTAGIYYWQVKSIDHAGNIGAFSAAQKIETR